MKNIHMIKNKNKTKLIVLLGYTLCFGSLPGELSLVNSGLKPVNHNSWQRGIRGRLWAAWSSGWRPCLRQGGWKNYMIFEVLFRPRSFYDSMNYHMQYPVLITLHPTDNLVHETTLKRKKIIISLMSYFVKVWGGNLLFAILPLFLFLTTKPLRLNFLLTILSSETQKWNS